MCRSYLFNVTALSYQNPLQAAPEPGTGNFHLRRVNRQLVNTNLQLPTRPSPRPWGSHFRRCRTSERVWKRLRMSLLSWSARPSPRRTPGRPGTRTSSPRCRRWLMRTQPSPWGACRMNYTPQNGLSTKPSGRTWSVSHTGCRQVKFWPKQPGEGGSSSAPGSSNAPGW